MGDDGEGARDNQFGIIEFVNGGHEGWRYWVSANGAWTNLDTEFAYGEWVTLKIELDADNQQYKFHINGDEVAAGVGGDNFLREVFLNSYNYGLEGGSDYQAHWHGGLLAVDPATKDDCKQGGFADFGFKNQGQCIQFVNTGKDSRD